MSTCSGQSCSDVRDPDPWRWAWPSGGGRGLLEVGGVRASRQTAVPTKNSDCFTLFPPVTRPYRGVKEGDQTAIGLSKINTVAEQQRK